MDGMQELAMALRRAHCDREGKEHECVGELTIKPGVVELDCKLCGTGSCHEGYDPYLADSLRTAFTAAGIDWTALSFDRRIAAIKAFKLK